MFAVFRKPKTFKLRSLHSQKKFGVAGRSCEEVLRKGCLHLQLPVPGSRLCLYEDGTELTGDYFWSVPDNSELVLLTEGQSWQGYVSDISHFLNVFHKPHEGVIQAARQLLSGEQAPLRQKLLADLLHTVSENISAETRAEDPTWFEGLESRFTSKSSYLRYSCESRIRGYLREVGPCRRPGALGQSRKPALLSGSPSSQDGISPRVQARVVSVPLPFQQEAALLTGGVRGERGCGALGLPGRAGTPGGRVQTPHPQGCAGTPGGRVSEGRGVEWTGSRLWFEGMVRQCSAVSLGSFQVSSYSSMVGTEAQEEYVRVVDAMCRKLRAVQYNGGYFDRGAKAGRLCTPEGWFSCQGPFDVDDCASKHSINPYGNRESRVLFSTWNLDHV
ncbi:hypothetical protein HPG69_007001 [Diceros bicornis minor]|uniref:DNA fragmentation factor subunit beta n=1 Tax=Diceros bicornis minor TaxID=77932 RepID=A0A7J7ENY8_DICBM|nr:hypothetical protein HPG69_007001 [Diceros bicornis minor]